MKKFAQFVLALFVSLSHHFSFASEMVPYRVPAALPDVAQPPTPDALKVEGWLGARILANATNRLLSVDTGPLLEGFRKKPGVHPWIGEQIGKWMHCSRITNTRETELLSLLLEKSGIS
jgi:hypothetical protein